MKNIYSSLHILGGRGFWKKEGFQSHILLNSFLKYYLLHTRGKRRKCQDLDCTMIPENTADPFKPRITDTWGTGLCGRIPAISTVVREQVPGQKGTLAYSSQPCGLYGLSGDSPFPPCSSQGNSQKSRGSWAWHWSTTWSHFSRRNNCKGNHSLLHKWRTNGKNPHSWDTLRGQKMPSGEDQELLLKTHPHWLWTNLSWLWPSSTMCTVTPWECRAWLPSDPSLFLTQKEKKKRHDKMHTNITRGTIKLS